MSNWQKLVKSGHPDCEQAFWSALCTAQPAHNSVDKEKCGLTKFLGILQICDAQSIVRIWRLILVNMG
jgi:hypothetical protein